MAGRPGKTGKGKARNNLIDSKRFRVPPGGQFRLAARKTDDTHPYPEKSAAEGHLQQGVARLAELQDKLHAQDRWSVLVLFQAMDAAGKDGTIKHVLSGLNPQGCQAFAFKQPSAEELDHDFLWRTNRALPERGRIGVFNRSYYEEVLVVRVHPEILSGQRLPPELVTKNIWKERFEDINALERHLVRNGTRIVKIFLNVSRAEQKKRLLARLDDPEKNWKFSMADLAERRLWNDYQKAYEEMLAATSTAHAPWHVIPADNKWFARLAVADVIVEAMEALDLHYPKLSPEKQREIETVRARMKEANGGNGAPAKKK